LSRVQVQLLTQPRLALAAAGELARKWPARPEPLVLQARAQTRLKAFPEAWQLWQSAAQGGYDFRSAHALHDYAVAAAMNGQAELALGSYRRLLTLLSIWHDPSDQQRIYIEAAAAALRQGPSGLDEASGYLSAARTRAVSTGLRAYVASMQALVSELRGQSTSSAERIDAAEIWHFLGLIRSERRPAYWPVLPPHEASGAASLSIEKYSLAEAVELWEAYVQGLKQTGADPKQQELARARARRLAGAGGSKS
jgi:hypothetical protein